MGRDSLPALDSIWKERDGRFERYIRVDGYEGLHSQPEPKVIIQTVSRDGHPATRRYTKATLSAFGKRYLPMPTPNHAEKDGAEALADCEVNPNPVEEK